MNLYQLPHWKNLLIAIPAGLAISAGCTTSAPVEDAPVEGTTSSEEEVQQDEFLWLEEVEGEEALEWVKGVNERSLEHLQSQPLFEPIYDRTLEILTSEDRIAYPSLRGGKVYNFWRDGTHVRGIWRVTSRQEYRENPNWDMILDIDALAEEEDENWVWGGADCRYPAYDRCLISLSIGGADASVQREFDLETREFVEDGFYLGESKSSIFWRDKDSVFFGPAYEDDQMTSSGYARQVYIWERGTDWEDAELIYEGEKDDVYVGGWRMWDKDTSYDIIRRAVSFYSGEYYFWDNEEAKRIDIPDDARITGVLDGQLLVELKSDWEVGGATFLQGAILAATMESVMAGEPEFAAIFEPNERQSVSQVAVTENTVLVGVLDNVVGSLRRFIYGEEGWSGEELDVSDFGSVRVMSTENSSDQFYYNYTGFLTPSSLMEADAMADTHEVVRSSPEWFNKEGMEVVQHEAESADGTMIPYFVVTPAGFEADGTNPTLLGGYGGFEVSRTPYYSGILGTSWLERGGVYVLANIRGGGEFGPRWHQAALLGNRQRAFDDFIAVAEDLIERDITSPEHLGIQGGSNGGLLVGAVMVQRPELFNAVVCQVPLLDMKRYHRLLAGASWMAEYGDPDIPEQWEWLSKYSPFQNVSAEADYPEVFFTTSTRDDRVHPGHARRMVARMMEQEHDVLYYENIEGGHGGAANQEQRAFVIALTNAYLHTRLSNAGDTEDSSELDAEDLSQRITDEDLEVFAAGVRAVGEKEAQLEAAGQDMETRKARANSPVEMIEIEQETLEAMNEALEEVNLEMASFLQMAAFIRQNPILLERVSEFLEQEEMEEFFGEVRAE